LFFLNWNKDQIANVTVKVLDLNLKEVAKKEYKNIQLKGGRTVNSLEPFMPEGLKEGYYFVVYEIN